MLRRRCAVRQVQGSEAVVAEMWVRSHRRLAGLLCLLAAGAVVFAGINLLQTFGPIHLHDDGPLGSLSGAGFSFNANDPGPWTSGYELCLQQGSTPAVLESVTPAGTVGNGLRYLGAYVRQIPADTVAASYTGGIAAIDGFPPKVNEALRPVAGFAVTRQCDYNVPNPPPLRSPAELDIGAGKPAGFTGGGWSGFTVTYRVGRTEYVVTWDTGLYACGPHAPAVAMCGAPG